MSKQDETRPADEPPMTFRTYDPEKDREAVHRIWRETGWVSSDDEEKMMDVFLSDGRIIVADLDGAPECLAMSVPGTFRYLQEDLSFSAVAAVTTSRVVRKLGLAKRLTAELVANDAAAGAKVSALGMFEQGFYDQLGYGTGGYEHWISFDPADIKTDVRARVPRRLGKDDWELIHKSLLGRKRGHGACNLLPATVTQAELGWTENGFGLGYSDGAEDGLTHFFWGKAKGETGPYTVRAMAYQNGQQFLELMALIKTLGDQVRMVWMREPRGIQMQDLLLHPFRHRQVTSKSEFENRNKATAYWQVRICDLAGCLSQTHLRREVVRFNLKLHDPIQAHLPPDAEWRGLTGDYLVTLGPMSAAEPGTDPDLPVLTATVGAFTRLWLGVRPATGLAVTDALTGPEPLLEALDDALCLPEAGPDWDF
jgi:hypothetical protein